MLLGEHGLTLDYLERLASQEGGLAEWAMPVPIMDPIRCDPRFDALVQGLKMTDPYFARVCGNRQ